MVDRDCICAKMRLIPLLPFTLLLLWTSIAVAHPGTTNKLGCHREDNVAHCHDAQEDDKTVATPSGETAAAETEVPAADTGAETIPAELPSAAPAVAPDVPKAPEAAQVPPEKSEPPFVTFMTPGEGARVTSPFVVGGSAPSGARVRLREGGRLVAELNVNNRNRWAHRLETHAGEGPLTLTVELLASDGSVVAQADRTLRVPGLNTQGSERSQGTSTTGTTLVRARPPVKRSNLGLQLLGGIGGLLLGNAVGFALGVAVGEDFGGFLGALFGGPVGSSLGVNIASSDDVRPGDLGDAVLYGELLAVGCLGLAFVGLIVAFGSDEDFGLGLMGVAAIGYPIGTVAIAVSTHRHSEDARPKRRWSVAPTMLRSSTEGPVGIGVGIDLGRLVWGR